MKHLKNAYSERYSLSQLNKALAIVAQPYEEKFLQYGSRVNKIFANLIEFIEYTYNDVDGRSLSKTALETTREYFVTGLQ